MSTSSVEAAQATPLAVANGLRKVFDIWAEEEPVRAELYSLEHLEVHARQLAEQARLAPRSRRGREMLRRFGEIGRDLERAYRRIAEASRREESITTDAEWLLDNYHIVEETLREVRQDLPRGYYRELPKLDNGLFAGFPRVYALALELIAHTDSSLEEPNVTRFVQAYQTNAPLTIGELWAVPIMLRLGLLENLRRLGRQMLRAWADRRQAEVWKARLLAGKDRDFAESDHRFLAPSRRLSLPGSDSFVVHLLQLLRDHGPEACAGIDWLENHLTRRSETPTEVLRREHQRQAANQVSVGNCVTSLRLLSALDWAVFFERTSLVEAELRKDPAGVYARQDFPTRDRYRRTIENFARGCHCDELEVARRVLEKTRRRQGPPAEEHSGPALHDGNVSTSHCGFYLVGPGRAELEKAIGYRPKWKDWVHEFVLAHAKVIYFGAVAIATALLLFGLVCYCWTWRGAGGSLLPLLLVLFAAAAPASEVAIGLVHYLITLLLPPRVLPKMDFKGGISSDCATFIVMPTMLLREESAEVLTERLEIHYLSNPDSQLRFALLADFADAPLEQMPEDATYLQAALDRIKVLNDRYSRGGPDRFFLFHRRRQWNPAMNCWMGWERKRGKLIEFNRLLRGARDTSFTTISGSLDQVPPIRYVITLDADTKLPREAAQRLVATLAHPLNRPRFAPGQGRVIEGYGVLQPRVSLGLVAATRSLFARLFASSAGLDPYTTAVSDVYQDLFGIGTFTGKGIYDVDAFQASVGQTFPENRILSHDLIEGNYARCGLVTDIELFDDFPSVYPAFAWREHRWARGDWQILPWLFRYVPAPEKVSGTFSGPSQRPNPLPAVERWKIFDNLRRSVVPPSLILLVLLGWIALPGSPWFWTALTLAVPALPLCLQAATGFFHLVRDRSWRLQWRGLRRNLGATAGQVLLTIVFLAEQARLMVDAILRTLARLFVTRRGLLEWETAASTERRLGIGLVDFCRNMVPSLALAALIGLVVLYVRPDALLPAGPVLFAWLVSPGVGYWVSQPRRVREAPLTDADRQTLRRLARKTWHFFETFVTQDDHWLPPDNYQEDPKGQLAHRTSPTNIGFYLLSSLAAHDLGYCSLSALVERLENTFATLDQLERYRGHLYNWYDTQTLRPMQPGYISTVDSGNLLGCLQTLKQGLREKIETPFAGRSLRDGLADALVLLTEALRGIEPPSSPEPLAVFRTLEDLILRLDEQLQKNPRDLREWHGWLEPLHECAQQLNTQSQTLSDMLQETPEDFVRWVRCFCEQVQDCREALAKLAPWLSVAVPAESGRDQDNGDLPPPALASWREWQQRLLAIDSVAEFQMQVDPLLADLEIFEQQTAREGNVPLGAQSALVRKAIEASRVSELVARCQSLADRASALAAAMDFRVLYNEQRHLFSIGYNLATGRLDNAHYDLLASEACLTSFLAIARGEVPRRHWFQTGRPLTRAAGGIALVSWGGTMFEYLMPRLLLRAYPGTLLDESWKTAVHRQIEYGRQNRVPWGISESAFSALDTALDYQYQSFGVPGLGLKRGLAKDLVIAPYATALALAIDRRAAVDNFAALAAEKAEGIYGFYEAVDFTRDRLREKRRSAVVRSFMAHHQGMSLVALANCLLDEPMPRRFHSEPLVRATEILLQERVPLVAPLVHPHGDEAAASPVVREQIFPLSRHLTTANTPHPRVHLLSNRQYNVMITNAGAGYSTWRDLDVMRWREDRTCDAWGQFCYVRDLRSGVLWSTSYQPLGRAGDEYEVIYSTDKAEFRRVDGNIETHWEITVSPENSAEVRRVTITNHDSRIHDLELTSYAEVVLHTHGTDLAHPAFAKLFLETEFVGEHTALLCQRRPRSPEQKPVWAIHVLAVDGPTVGPIQYETDRLRFLGRGRSVANPAALEQGAVLSGTTGPVLDPIFSIRRRIRVAPQTSMSVAFTTAVAESRDEALTLADHYHDFHGVARAFEMAWAHSQVELRHLHLSAGEGHLYQRLAGQIVYAGGALRPLDAAAANRQGAPGLWRHGLSGAKPIVLLRVAETEELALVQQLLLAHTYWRLRGLEVDLVLLNEHPASYLEELHQQLQNLVRSSDAHLLVDKPGGVFVKRAVHLSEDDKVLLQAGARVVLVGNRGSLASQIDRQETFAPLPPQLALTVGQQPFAPEFWSRPLSGASPTGSKTTNRSASPQDAVLLGNGRGDFSTDGREYVIHVGSSAIGSQRQEFGRAVSSPQGSTVNRERAGESALPPAPWVNIVANPAFGFLISESGAGYTWAGNSQSNRLTVWSNDPVCDPPGEIVYLRDEATGEVWTPTPLPRGMDAATVVRHGQGHTRFHQESHGLAQELLLLVPPDEPIKLVCLKVRNTGNQFRRLSATFYVEWVLGTVRDQAPMQVVCSLDPESGALLARNPWNLDFANRVAFADVSERPRSFTADRAEFLGRNGSAAAPGALSRVALSGNAGPTSDPCAALMAKWDLRPREEKEITFFLGQAADLAEAQRLLRRHRAHGRSRQTMDEVRQLWDDALGAVQVRTPDSGFNLLLNRWLPYQVLSCRVWGRSAFYQSGGAYGFRDQLQDVMALVYGAADEARAHLLRAAGRQFIEGDVQHWWHPPVGRGIRTRFSDDLLWLPFATCHYVTTTGDVAVLDERAPFLRAPTLKPGQEEEYGLPETSEETGALYEHCVRALEHGFQLGAHGLPLMGTGDWNDGMNRVGAGGKGESVWVGWFLVAILRDFAALADRRADSERANWCRERAQLLCAALEEHAWDGRWYRRAYFDDGTPLGSEQNDECKIDSIAQTWAVISGAANPQRARQAMDAVEEHLVKEEEKLILLFTPPFDQGKLQPGYVKGYVPGIRENGGQYTHAAIWVVQATALLGRGNRALELFNFLSPIEHASTPEGVARYRVEPYVIAADVYSQPPHTGRGGWTWYTGSAGWLYRVGLETILGFHLRGNKLLMEPCIASHWSECEIVYRHRSATYRITVENPSGVERGVRSVTVDGQIAPKLEIELRDDGCPHEVRVVLG